MGKWYLPRTADGFKWEVLGLSSESGWQEDNWSYFRVKALAHISKRRTWTLEHIDFKMYNAPYISDLDNEPSLCSLQTCSLGRLLGEERARITFKLNGNKGCIFLNFDQRVSDVTDAFKSEIIWDCVWSRICLSPSSKWRLLILLFTGLAASACNWFLQWQGEKLHMRMWPQTSLPADSICFECQYVNYHIYWLRQVRVLKGTIDTYPWLSNQTKLHLVW